MDKKKPHHPNSLANLKPFKEPPYPFDNKEIARKAGLASGAAKRRKKAEMELFASEASALRTNVATVVGVEPHEITPVHLMEYYMYQAALEGDQDTATDLANKISPYRESRRQAINADIKTSETKEMSDEEIDAKIAQLLQSSTEEGTEEE